MSSEDREKPKEYKKGYKSGISTRSTVVQRSSGGFHPSMHGMGMGGHGGGGFSMSMRQSMAPPGFAPGTISAATKTGISAMHEGRAHEKKDLQGLNERLAGYIEKVRYLEAQNKALLAELDKCKKSKSIDLDKFKDMYEEELSAARKCIDDLSKGKADCDAQLAGLEDALDAERAEALEANKRADQLRGKVDQLCDQVGNLEGDLKACRLHCDQLTTDLKNARDQNARLHDDVKRLRCDVDNETAAHIAEAAKCQTLEEELAFLKEMYEAQIAELNAMINADKGQEIQDIWKGELQRAVRDMQAEYDRQLEGVRTELDAKFDMQLREMRSGSTRDTVEVATVREENKKLKSKVSDLQKRCADLEADNARLKAAEREYQNRIAELERELEDAERSHTEEIAKLRAELEECLAQLQTLMDAKLTLELEIACYRGLLEGEESRVGLKQVVENVTDTRSSGGQKLADIIGSSSFSGESQGKMTVHRKSKGIIAVTEASPEGKYVILENTSSGVRKKNQDLYGYKLRKETKNGPSLEYKFTEHYDFQPGATLKIYSKSAAPSQTELTNEKALKADCYTWGTGTGDFMLFDSDQNERSTLTLKFS